MQTPIDSDAGSAELQRRLTAVCSVVWMMLVFMRKQIDVILDYWDIFVQVVAVNQILTHE